MIAEVLAAPAPTVAPSATTVPPDVMQLTREQVRELLAGSAGFRALAPAARRAFAHDLVKIAAYDATLAHEQFEQSRKLGQVPVRVRPSETPLAAAVRALGAAPAGALAQKAPAVPANEFSPRAASQVASITEQTLKAVAFPRFVADLIKGTFQAIVDASIRQMEAFGALLANVSKTVDQFMAENITDNQGRDLLAGRYPGHFRVDASDGAPRLRVRDGADDLPKPNFRSEFNLKEDVDLDDDEVEEKLVPAARRQLAESRHRMLSTMMLMGINRIVVTSGRIHAKMGFHIDASDTGRVQTAEEFDTRNELSMGYGGGVFGAIFGGPSASFRSTTAYVSTTKKDTSDAINVETDLTGEVDLKFKSDYFPLERFADTDVVNRIQKNTANPSANTATGSLEGKPARSAEPAA